MTDLLLQFGVSNLLMALALALAAWAVHARGKWPVVAHLLWVIVLVKLVTPPIITVPMVPIPGAASSAPATLDGGPGIEAAGAATLLVTDSAMPETPDPAAGGVTVGALVEAGKTGLIALWLLGSACILGWSLVRIIRFHRLLGIASRPAPDDLHRTAARIAKRLGLRRVPLICTTSAQVSPMVWWAGGRVRIVIPESLVRGTDMGQLRWILAHELAHVRRRDHVVRWLEWLACVCFWWNPIAWWARRNLRINEEVCCDALVLDTLRPQPRVYANALINVIEFLASPAIRPPAVASEISGGGFLERRFDMIISKERAARTPRWLLSGILLATVGLMPLGVAYGQDLEAVGKRLREAVAAGELNEKQAHLMLDALRRSAEQSHAVNRERQAVLDELAAAETALEAAINMGKVNEADAAARLTELKATRDAMAAYAAQTETDANDAAAALAEAEFRAAVEAGRISEDEAKSRFDAALSKHKAAAAQRETNQELRGLEQIVEEIQAAVEAGKLSKEDAHKRLTALLDRMAESKARAANRLEEAEIARRTSDFRRMEQDRADAEEAAARNRAQYLQLLADDRWQLFVDAERAIDESKARVDHKFREVIVDKAMAEHDLWLRAVDEHESTRQAFENEYAQHEAALRKAIAAGRISILEAAERLTRLREEMAASQAKSKTVRAEEANRRMAEFMRRVEEALASGQISPEEARNAFEQARRAMAESMNRGGGDR